MQWYASLMSSGLGDSFGGLDSTCSIAVRAYRSRNYRRCSDNYAVPPRMHSIAGKKAYTKATVAECSSCRFMLFQCKVNIDLKAGSK